MLTWWRDRRGWSRQALSDQIRERDLLPFQHRHAVVVPASAHRPPGAQSRPYTVRWWDGPRRRYRTFGSLSPARAYKVKQDALVDAHEVTPDEESKSCTTCGVPITGGLTRDAIAKLEHGERRPKGPTVQALCAALSTEYEIVRPEMLQPGGPVMPLSEEGQERLARLEFQRGMRELADALGRPELYRDPRTNRIRYTDELYEMYEDYLDSNPAVTGHTAVA
jgi:hypothetical protein